MKKKKGSSNSMDVSIKLKKRALTSSLNVRETISLSNKDFFLLEKLP